VTFKVPTGGGKTYLAVSALSRILGAYLGRNSGFVLWIVPNDAIYTQTKKQFLNREHPYRQILDRAAAGRVKILEKEDRLDARDVDTHLCVMLLMLQSANRETKETLRLFRDRGNVHGFFPNEGDFEAQERVLRAIPNLDAYNEPGGSIGTTIKDSLGNVLRLIHPIVVMDEGHRAISDLAFRTLYGFNPDFVLELTATPKDKPKGDSPVFANVLVDILGADLDREGMIKMPLNVGVKAGKDWRNTLRAAKDKLEELSAAAERLRAERDRYIRPILLVQVERTGKDQRDGVHIHAEDARDWLLRVGFGVTEIAVKTADTNDLTNPENLDLLSPTCPVRVIITKQALQEGWDCPFAYVLCALAASQNLGALTQLVGRILRQPHAEKTGVPALDECYAYCHHEKTGEVIAAIRDGLERDGLGDLVTRLIPDEGSSRKALGTRKIERRNDFRDLEIFLPLVLAVEEGRARALDYEHDVMSELDWRNLDVSKLVAKIPEHVQAPESQMQRIRLTDDPQHRILAEEVGHTPDPQRFDPVYAVRHVSDIVPNPWVAREIVGTLLDGLRKRGFRDAHLGAVMGLIVETSRTWLTERRDEMAEKIFRSSVKQGRIQFRLRADAHNWVMPVSMTTGIADGERQLANANGGPLERSLFAPIYESELNSEERDVAIYLDGQRALTWWHRNVAQAGHYSLQGWRKERVYPDFIFALDRSSGANRMVVLEMKGEHLGGNPDTEYKRDLMRFLSEHYTLDKASFAGKLELVARGGTTVECDLVLMPEWKTRLPQYFTER
jgi:type III restriction enzyme